MESDELKSLLQQAPVRITMNNGQTFEIPHSEFATVGDYTAALLIKHDARMVHRVITLMNISDVEVLAPGQKA